MESAKNAVKDLLSKHGQKTTDVHTTTAPAVTNETVNRTHENRDETVVDREIHQDHHHTTVQPVTDTQVKTEQHHHKIAPTTERHLEHDDAERVKEKLAAERAQFQNTSRTVDAGNTQTVGDAAVGEHVHHHVHEHIQPVIQREVHEPHVTHTTKPVHEVHHNASQHHHASVLPAVSLDEFSKGNSLTGGKTEHTRFNDEPELVAKSAKNVV